MEQGPESKPEVSAESNPSSDLLPDERGGRRRLDIQNEKVSRLPENVPAERTQAAIESKRRLTAEEVSRLIMENLRGKVLPTEEEIPSARPGAEKETGSSASQSTEEQEGHLTPALSLVEAERVTTGSHRQDTSLNPLHKAEREVAPAAPVADFIPARMLNEFVYCPRLFYYEHVEGVFVENADTLRGSAVHQRVDSGSGALPAPKEKKEERTPEKDRHLTLALSPVEAEREKASTSPNPLPKGRGGKPER